eukprot:6189434-Pleurochrysis_carterae.AAC.6
MNCEEVFVRHSPTLSAASSARHRSRSSRPLVAETDAAVFTMDATSARLAFALLSTTPPGAAIARFLLPEQQR